MICPRCNLSECTPRCGWCDYLPTAAERETVPAPDWAPPGYEVVMYDTQEDFCKALEEAAHPLMTLHTSAAIDAAREEGRREAHRESELEARIVREEGRREERERWRVAVKHLTEKLKHQPEVDARAWLLDLLRSMDAADE